MTALTHLVGNENDVPSDATPWGVWTFNENGVFLPISRRSALLFLRVTLDRGEKMRLDLHKIHQKPARSCRMSTHPGEPSVTVLEKREYSKKHPRGNHEKRDTIYGLIGQSEQHIICAERYRIGSRLL
jgi:hypothetical protein